jgi:hypothetical protein
MRAQTSHRREPRKPKIRKAKRMARYMFDEHGRQVPFDASECLLMLCVHRLSDRGLAWLVSRDGNERDAVWVPRGWIDIGEACGGFERMDHKCQRVLIPIYECSMPRNRAVEKGLTRPLAKAFSPPRFVNSYRAA